jgi:UDP-sugar transporter A1/2/3
MNLKPTAILALGLFVIHNACAALLMRYTQLHHPRYNNAVAVLLQELAVKLPACAVLYAHEVGGPLSMLRALRADAIAHPEAWLHVGLPALLYTVQNNAIYVGYSHLDASVGMLVYQSKILFTAAFSVYLLARRLGRAQWSALVLLSVGVGLVIVYGLRSGRTPVKHGHGHGAPHGHGPAQNPLLGFGAFLIAALCTSAASVYFESVIKATPHRSEPQVTPSLWLRSLQLCVYASAVAALGVALVPDPHAATSPRGWLHGFTLLPWLCVLWNGAGGLLVAVCMKQADNILRGFAQGLAIICSALGSYLLFALQPTTTFLLGSLLVLASIPTYANALPRSLAALAPTCCVDEDDEVEVLELKPARRVHRV